MTFGNYNLQLSIQYILLPSVPIPVIRLLAMVHLQHDGPPVALLGLPKLLHHLVDRKPSFSRQVQPAEFERRQEVFSHIGDRDSTVGLNDPVQVAPAGAKDVPLLHKLANISASNIGI